MRLVTLAKHLQCGEMERAEAGAAQRRGAAARRGGHRPRALRRASTRRSTGVPFELILVDDASTDAHRRSCSTRSPTPTRACGVLHLSRNFGHQAALTAGLEHARGDAVAMLDGDLQDPPELLPKMLAHWRSGSDVVSAVRTERAGESRLKLTTARWFYRVFAKLSDLDLTQDAGDFRLLDRRALDALLSMRERNRFLRGMSAWVGYTPDRGAVRARRAARRRDEVHAPQDAALLARRDHLVLAAAAPARDRARLPSVGGRACSRSRS